jgi:diguanylate cyclase (GGDEF)-like protein
MYSYKKIILQPLLLTSFLLILAMGWVFFTMIQLIDSLENKEIIDLKVYHVLELTNALSGIKNNQINYTLTQNLMYLVAYKASVEKAKINFEKIRQLNNSINALNPMLDQIESQLLACFQYKSKLLDKEAGTYSPHLASQDDKQAYVIDSVISKLYTVDQLLFKQSQLLHKKIKSEIKTTIISGIFLIVSVFFVLIYSYRKTITLFKSVAEKETVVNSLSYQAEHDPLTGLLNRRGFELALERVYFNARQVSRQFAIVYIDLDGFKLINDHFGHEVGDQLLIKVGKLFSGVLREGDYIARLGGDEFALIIEQFKYQEELSQLAIRLIATLDHPVLIEGLSTDIGASVGLASYPKHAKNVQALIVEADNAMYQAKKTGKNRHCFAQAA